LAEEGADARYSLLCRMPGHPVRIYDGMRAAMIDDARRLELRRTIKAGVRAGLSARELSRAIHWTDVLYDTEYVLMVVQEAEAAMKEIDDAKLEEIRKHLAAEI
jgi:hypothetical protein